MITLQPMFGGCVIIRVDGKVYCIYRPNSGRTVRDILDSIPSL